MLSRRHDGRRSVLYQFRSSAGHHLQQHICCKCKNFEFDQATRCAVYTMCANMHVQYMLSLKNYDDKSQLRSEISITNQLTTQSTYSFDHFSRLGLCQWKRKLLLYSRKLYFKKLSNRFRNDSICLQIFIVEAVLKVVVTSTHEIVIKQFLCSLRL